MQSVSNTIPLHSPVLGWHRGFGHKLLQPELRRRQPLDLCSFALVWGGERGGGVQARRRHEGNLLLRVEG